MAQIPLGQTRRQAAHIQLESVLLLGILLLAIAAWLLTAQTWVYVVVPLAVCLAVVAYWVISGMVSISVSRRLSAVEVEYGGRFRQEMVCTPRNGLSRFAAHLSPIEVVDESVVPGMASSGLVGSIGADGALPDMREVKACTRWGAFQQGPTTIKITGFYNTFTRGQVTTDAARVVVLPPIIPLPSCWLDKIVLRHDRLPPQIFEDTPQSRRRPQPPLTVGSRPFRPGDPLRHVDWRPYARTLNSRDLRTKTFARPPSDVRIWLALDTAVDTQVWNQPGLATFVEQTLAVATLALAAHWLRGQSLEVGVLAGPFGASELYQADEGQSGYATQVRQIQRLLATTLPHPASAGGGRARETLTDQLFTRLATGYGRTASNEVVVLLSAAHPKTWETVTSTVQERGIPVAVVDGSPIERGEQWPVPVIQLLPPNLSRPRLPETLDGWAQLMHTLTEPATAESFKRRVVG